MDSQNDQNQGSTTEVVDSSNTEVENEEQVWPYELWVVLQIITPMKFDKNNFIFLYKNVYFRRKCLFNKITTFSIKMNAF